MKWGGGTLLTSQGTRLFIETYFAFTSDKTDDYDEASDGGPLIP